MNALKRWNRLKDLEAFQHDPNNLLGSSSLHRPAGRQATLFEKSVAIASPMWTSIVTGAGSVELDDLSRFEGEGGPEGPIPDLVDVPLDNAIWRRPRWAAYQANQKKITL